MAAGRAHQGGTRRGMSARADRRQDQARADAGPSGPMRAWLRGEARSSSTGAAGQNEADGGRIAIAYAAEACKGHAEVAAIPRAGDARRCAER